MVAKTRSQREQELQRLFNTPGGCKKIVEMYERATGLPPGTCAPVGTPIRTVMIPEILNCEYPNG
jgi:hypothetical protein